jgi:hypothetical protein
MRRVLKLLLEPLFRHWKPCQSYRGGFPTYPYRPDSLGRNEKDLIYCELIEGHAGRHRGRNPQNEQFWYWTGESESWTKNQEIKDGVVYYSVKEYWDEFKWSTK